MAKNNKKKFSGITTALVTPFFEGKIDWESVEKLLLNQVEQGVTGFVINGTTAESPTLSEREVKDYLEFAKKVLSGCKFEGPIILGTGSNSTSKTVEFSKKAEQWGADGCLVVVPYYNKPPQRGLVAHFTQIADATQLPILLYNVPGRTVTALSINSIAELSQHPNIVGLKEASGDLRFLEELKSRITSDFVLLSGDDASCFEFMAKGGDGVISVCSHLLGKEMKKLLEPSEFSWNKAQAGFSGFLPLINAFYLEANPIPIKQALFETDIIRSSELRLPLMKMDDQLATELRNELVKFGLIRES